MACDACGSTRWKKDAGGNVVCSFGHVRTGNEQVHEDAAQLMGASRRSMRSARVSTKSTETTTKAADLPLQFQSLLKRQISWFIEHKDIPPQFTHMVRDIWLMYISKQKVAPVVWASLVFCHIALMRLNSEITVPDILAYLWLI